MNCRPLKSRPYAMPPAAIHLVETRRLPNPDPLHKLAKDPTKVRQLIPANNSYLVFKRGLFMFALSTRSHQP